MSARIKFASDIKGLALSFKEGSTIRTDLEHMAYALDNMSDDRFKTAHENEVPKQAGNDDAPAITGVVAAQQNKESAVKKANTSTNEYWSKEASERVLQNLVRQVVGSSVKTDASGDRPDAVRAAALPKEDVADGSNQPGLVAEGVAPVATASIPKEAVPSVAENLDSKMVEKAHAVAIVKEAGEEVKEGCGTVEAAAEPVAQPAGFTQTACGITLAGETMGYGVEITASEQAQLDQLFA